MLTELGYELFSRYFTAANRSGNEVRPKLQPAVIRVSGPGTTILVWVVCMTNLACQIIERDTHVRLKIVGTRVDATEIVSLRLRLSSLVHQTLLL